MPLPLVALEEDRTEQLERALKLSRAGEESGRQALKQLRKDLNDAYFQVAQQKQKLEILSKKLRVGNSVSGEGDASTAYAKLADLKRPESWCRKLDLSLGEAGARPEVKRYPQRDGAWAEINALWEKLPAWTKGTISTQDALFFDGLIDELRPDRIYEVGVAAGTSSALILSSMAKYADPTKIWLHSYDISPVCYFDQSHNVGEATHVMAPNLIKNWKLNTGMTALNVPDDAETCGKALYFIDANHSHPWPTLDLIALLPVLKTGDCVILHDINLPTITEGKFPDHGAEWLFEDWLGERSVLDLTLPNIGAIIIPEDKNIVLSSLAKTLAREWPIHFKADDHLFTCERALIKFVTENRLG